MVLEVKKWREIGHVRESGDEKTSSKGNEPYS